MLITELAAILGSRVENLKADFDVSGITTLEDAQTGQISFITEKKYLSGLASSKASAVLVPESIKSDLIPYIPLSNTWAGILAVLNQFHPNSNRVWYAGVHATATIDPTAVLANNVSVGPHAVIGPRTSIGAGTAVGPGCVVGPDCIIGEDCVLGPTSVLETGTQIGKGVILQAGAVLGADGFKYETINGSWTKIPQVGRVVLGDHVEIGSNTCVDRASYVETRIGRNTKIDNQVQIAHNAIIGENCIIVSQCGIAGSSVVGDNLIMAAQSGIADNVKVGNKVVILSRAAVKDNLADGETVLGVPARPFRHQARIFSVENRLPELAAEVSRLTKKVEELETRLAQNEKQPEA